MSGARAIVVGIGNYLLGDDGVGNVIVQQLKEQNEISGLDFVVGETDVDFCMEIASKARLLFLVDAMISGKEPAEVSFYSLQQARGLKHFRLSQHNQNFIHSLELKENIYVIGIEPQQFDFHVGISAELQQKLPEIVGKVVAYIKHVLQEG